MHPLAKNLKLKIFFGALLLIMCFYMVLFKDHVFADVIVNDIHYMDLTKEEKTWLKEHQGKPYVLGLDAEAGLESFFYEGEQIGYIHDLMKDIEKDLGIHITVASEITWMEAMKGLEDGRVDLVAGANETPVRLYSMAFTRPIQSIPYAVLARKESDLSNLGDINNKRIGFLNGDAISERLRAKFQKLSYTEIPFGTNSEGLELLNAKDVDAIIVSGGPVVYNYLDTYKSLKKVCEVEYLMSDMNLSALKENKILISILDKYIQYELDNGRLASMIKSALRNYVQRILQLTKEELDWIKFDGRVIFGVTDDYLPFDYMINGEYKGINGAICDEIVDLIGIKAVYKQGDFSKLYDMLLTNQVNVLSVAKTEERAERMRFPMAYINERDRIFGKTRSSAVFDISGLSGTRVAVIEGYYQIAMLEKNKIDAKLVYCNNIEECIRAVENGKADYLIENMQVVNYYLSEMGVYDIVEKGITSADTRLYFGISLDQPELASILNKLIPLLDIKTDIEKGLETAPRKKNFERYVDMLKIIGGLTVLLAFIGIALFILFKQLLKETTEREILAQKEEILYRDGLTGLYNRNYYNDKIRSGFDEEELPHALIVFDLNNLKQVNDTYGHSTGDEILKAFGEKILKLPEDILSVRLGGDEFVLFLKGVRARNPEAVIQEMEKRCVDEPLHLGDDIWVSLSFAKGFAIRYTLEVSLDELFRVADSRMYSDKNYRKRRY